MNFRLNPIIMQQKLQVWSEWFKSEKPIFQLSVAVISLSFLLALCPPFYEFASFTPSSLFLLHIWRPVTAALFEPNPILLAFSIFGAHQLIHVIEPLWGLSELAKFSAIVEFGSVLVTSLIALGSFALFGAVDFFYFMKLNGLTALNLGALVAVKQFLPDTVLLTTSKGRLKNTHLPLSALALLTLAYIFDIVRPGAVIQAAVGMQVSWTYLRFFQRKEIGQDGRGDPSEHFAWHTLFPRITHPIAIAIGKFVYRSLVKMKLLRKIENMVLPQIQEQEMFALDLDRETERKRQIALRELQARLLQQKRAAPSPPPTTSSSAPLRPVPEQPEQQHPAHHDQPDPLPPFKLNEV